MQFQFVNIKEYAHFYRIRVDFIHYIDVFKDDDHVECMSTATFNIFENHEYSNFLKSMNLEDRLEYVKTLKISKDSLNKFNL